ncbi:DUF3667 domain-containing protein [Aquimarina sp. AU474]|uniref:DUF3667 domain-containing protein n=1 Tax=Aquimarina sp. AU474 TaxID=2108529 RepID=UPI000D69519E|nr:DUF3667 domain-containing protein [Aquimarina sp. AU474]
MNKLIVIDNCKNCGYNTDHNNFCSNCGAKKITKRITFRNIVSEFSEVYLNIDNTFFRTVKDLTTQPRRVIDGYINGVRKRHLNAISYLLIAVMFSAIFDFIRKKFFNSEISEQEKEKFPEVIRILAELSEEIPIFGYFILIPFYALISKFLFRKYKKYNFTEHVVINTYFISHTTILTILPAVIIYGLGLNIDEVSLFSFLLQFIFATYMFKNLYDITYKKVLKRVFLVLLASIFLFLAIAFIGGIILAISKEKGLTN